MHCGLAQDHCSSTVVYSHRRTRLFRAMRLTLDLHRVPQPLSSRAAGIVREQPVDGDSGCPLPHVVGPHSVERHAQTCMHKLPVVLTSSYGGLLVQLVTSRLLKRRSVRICLNESGAWLER